LLCRCGSSNQNQKIEHPMKLNRIITLCAMAATLASSALAQDNGGGQGGDQQGQGGGQRRFRNNGGGPGGPGGGFQNMTPEERQQMFVNNIRDRLEFTNDTDWSAVQPLVQKVVAAQTDARSGQMRGMFGGRNRGGNNADQGGQQRQRGGFGGTPSPEAEALQKALDDNAPAAQIKDLLAKYKASQQAKQAKLEAAQDDLKKVLSAKQEAQAYLLGLVR
jgi:hypothetical protein